MSISLMTAAWKLPIPAGPKMVLLALCDNANDQGECYPSVSMLVEKCSMSERAIQGHISHLEKLDLVARAMRSGRSTLYKINPRRICTPADLTPPQNLHPRRLDTPAESAPHPRRICTPPPQILHPTPAESAPITISEPSSEPSVNQKQSSPAPAGEHGGDAKPAKRDRGKPRPPDAEPICLPSWLPESAWGSLLDHRRAMKSPMTPKAQELALKALAEIRDAGHDPVAAIDRTILNGWKGVFPPKPNNDQKPQRKTPHDERADTIAALTGRRIQACRDIIDATPRNPDGLG